MTDKFKAVHSSNFPGDSGSINQFPVPANKRQEEEARLLASTATIHNEIPLVLLVLYHHRL